MSDDDIKDVKKNEEEKKNEQSQEHELELDQPPEQLSFSGYFGELTDNCVRTF